MPIIVCVEVVNTDDGTVSSIAASAADAETAYRIARRAVRAQGGIMQVAGGRATAVVNPGALLAAPGWR